MRGYQLGAGGRESNGVRVMSGQYGIAGDGGMSPHPRRRSRPKASVAVGVPRSCGLRPLQTAEELMPLLPWMLCGGITLGLQLCHKVGVDHGRLGVCINVKSEECSADVLAAWCQPGGPLERAAPESGTLALLRGLPD